MLSKKEKLYANLIGSFHTTSRNWARMIVKPNPIVKSKAELRTFIQGLGFGVNPVLSDRNYYFETWDKWLKAIEIDWTNINKYNSDSHDCDNFADSFNARMSEYYGWNTSGRLSVALRVPVTNKLIGYHRASLIVVKEGEGLEAYAYDPMFGMQDKYDKIENSFIRIKDWVYIPTYLSFN